MNKLTKKELQKRRMMSYFIEAAAKIIEEEGIQGITTRKVADEAGYNVATVYNYFKNLDHLIFFASLKFIKDYVLNLSVYTKYASNALEKSILIWECFCKYSFKKPKIYYAIFFNTHENTLKESIKEYYEIFPQELGQQRKDLLPMLLKGNIYERGMAALEECVKEGYIKKEDITHINEMILLIYQGMLFNIINKRINYSVEESVNRTMIYIKKTLYAFSKQIPG